MIPAAHDGDLRQAQRTHIASHEEKRGRIVDLLEQRGVARVEESDEMVGGILQPGEADRRGRLVGTLQSPDQSLGKASTHEMWRLCLKNPGGASEVLHEPAQGAPANARRRLQHKPGSRFVVGQGPYSGLVITSPTAMSRCASMTRP